jgi:hypothetical protein
MAPSASDGGAYTAKALQVDKAGAPHKLVDIERHAAGPNDIIIGDSSSCSVLSCPLMYTLSPCCTISLAWLSVCACFYAALANKVTRISSLSPCLVYVSVLSVQPSSTAGCATATCTGPTMTSW